MSSPPSPEDQSFQNTCLAIRSLIAQFAAEDVLVALCVSDLWLPNISSQVKHTLAWMIALSMPASTFSGSRTIKSYSDFAHFIGRLYSALPTFPSLEDYVPETDWGEVRYISNGMPLRIFYGGTVERISDFITAFELIHGSNAQALEDMNVALSVQDQLLTQVSAAIVGVADDIAPGHLEVPSEEFFHQCLEAIQAISTRTDFLGISPGLVLKLGTLPLPSGTADFANALMSGSALPGYLVEVGKVHFPLTLRNAVAAVIDYWADERSTKAAAAVGEFIAARMSNVMKGPLQVVTRARHHPFVYSAAILGGAKPYLIIAFGKSELARLPQVEIDLRLALATGDWALQRVGEHDAFQIRENHGPLQDVEQLVILAVLLEVTTASSFLQVPETQARLLPLTDFVTIFDSINDIDELDRYWEFSDSNAHATRGLSGQADQFAAFRDSHELLLGGATVPDWIMIDPHWGSTWRYRVLTQYWNNAPPLFPDIPHTAWNVERSSDGVYTLVARRLPAMCRATVIGACVLHFIYILGNRPFEPNDARILDLLLQCIVDALNQRKDILASLPLFGRRQIVTIFEANVNTLVSESNRDHADESLFSAWHVSNSSEDGGIHVKVDANLQHVQARLTGASDASFEVAAALAWVECVSSALGLVVESEVVDAMRDTSSRVPRFTMRMIRRAIDVPEHADPQVPGPEHYKLARRDLAVTFKDLGAEEGTYELAAAKALIDRARDEFRTSVHKAIAACSSSELLQFCIEQIEQLTSDYDRRHTQIEMSLSHDVSYDRAAALAEALSQFTKNAANYRYLLECCLSLTSTEPGQINTETAIRLVASVDWLLVLYNASDVLHNGLDVAGLELDHSFVPRVFYTAIADQRESSFAQEAADFRLGVGLNSADKVAAICESDPEWARLDSAFQNDTGISFRKFLSGLLVLCRWPTAISSSDLRFQYLAPIHRVCDVLIETVTDMTSTEADRFLSLVVLDPNGIRKLLGKSTTEGDVPIWEHNKRGDRYTIKPLIRIADGQLAWGAASAERSARIWRQTLANGYMPADYDWPNVKAVVRQIKQRLEKSLETTVASILQRATPYVMEGIDFKDRFPGEGFDDVGDFDGLGYWPALNRWVSVECKYNQPAFCLKDARRLRDRIFGTSENREQFAKIERRRIFLNDNLERIRLALAWPAPTTLEPPNLHELYISRDIYWWMRNPPYPVPTHFVRVDGLDGWLRSSGLLT